MNWLKGFAALDTSSLRSRVPRAAASRSLRSMAWSVVPVGALLAAVGCGGSDVPVRQLADAEASIRAAKEVGAENTPDAALQLKMANDRLNRAKQLSADGENETAAALLEEAEVDAELALLIARKEDAQTKAASAEKRATSFDQAKAAEPEKTSP